MIIIKIPASTMPHIFDCFYGMLASAIGMSGELSWLFERGCVHPRSSEPLKDGDKQSYSHFQEHK